MTKIILPSSSTDDAPVEPGICDLTGRWYSPGRGWFDWRTLTLENSGNKPEREARWFSI